MLSFLAWMLLCFINCNHFTFSFFCVIFFAVSFYIIMVGSSSFELGVPVLFSFYIITFVLSFGCHYFCFNIFYYRPFWILWKTWHSHTVCVPTKRKPCSGCVRKPVNVHNDGLSPEPEFLNILKCNSAESASRGFQFNLIIFFMIKTYCNYGISTTFQDC